MIAARFCCNCAGGWPRKPSLPPNYGARYNALFSQVYADVAGAAQVPLLGFFLEGVGGVPALMQGDGIHPNAAAQPRLLDNLWPQLKPLL